jgi:hypothetical protein
LGLSSLLFIIINMSVSTDWWRPNCYTASVASRRRACSEFGDRKAGRKTAESAAMCAEGGSSSTRTLNGLEFGHRKRLVG